MQINLLFVAWCSMYSNSFYGAFTLSNTDTDTATDTDTDNNGFNSNLCLFRCLCSVNSSTQFYKTHFLSVLVSGSVNTPLSGTQCNIYLVSERKSRFVHGMEGMREKRERYILLMSIACYNRMIWAHWRFYQDVLYEKKKTYCKIILLEIKICNLYDTGIHVLFQLRNGLWIRAIEINQIYYTGSRLLRAT